MTVLTIPLFFLEEEVLILVRQILLGQESLMVWVILQLLMEMHNAAEKLLISKLALLLFQEPHIVGLLTVALQLSELLQVL